MISIIICSINPKRVENIRRNVERTIGVEYELLVRDNRGTTDGICKVYNELAKSAKGDFLCFMHEDIEFDTTGWGKIMEEQAAKPECGVIGFAGAAIKTRAMSGVHHKHYEECNVADIVEGSDLPTKYVKYNYSGKEIAPAVTIDGVFMFVRREVYQRVGGYDQKTFTGFHLYDLDFSSSVFDAGYINYICHTVRFAHFSKGHYSLEWYIDSLKYQEKWEAKLPFYIETPSKKVIQKDEKYIYFNITYHLMKRSCLHPDMIKERVDWQLNNYPFYYKSWDNYIMYLKYKRRFNKGDF